MALGRKSLSGMILNGVSNFDPKRRKSGLSNAGNGCSFCFDNHVYSGVWSEGEIADPLWY
jgi:hypothetical protein